MTTKKRQAVKAKASKAAMSPIRQWAATCDLLARELRAAEKTGDLMPAVSVLALVVVDALVPDAEGEQKDPLRGVIMDRAEQAILRLIQKVARQPGRRGRP